LSDRYEEKKLKFLLVVGRFVRLRRVDDKQKKKKKKKLVQRRKGSVAFQSLSPFSLVSLIQRPASPTSPGARCTIPREITTDSIATFIDFHPISVALLLRAAC